MEFIRKVCCCNGELSDDEDERQLIDDEEDDFNVITARQNSSNQYGSNGHLPDNGIVPFMGFPALSAPQNPEGASHENEETTMLDSILNQTQQDIIDVSNMADNTGISNADYTSRARLYNDLVRKHDHGASMRSLNGAANGGEPKVSTGILNDVGNLVTDMLSRPGLPANTLDEIKTLSVKVTEAVNNGIKIENKDDLVVFMTLDD